MQARTDLSITSTSISEARQGQVRGRVVYIVHLISVSNVLLQRECGGMARHTRNTGKVNLTDNRPVDKGFVSALFGNTDFLLVDGPQREEHCPQKSPKIPLELSLPPHPITL